MILGAGRGERFAVEAGAPWFPTERPGVIKLGILGFLGEVLSNQIGDRERFPANWRAAAQRWPVVSFQMLTFHSTFFEAAAQRWSVDIYDVPAVGGGNIESLDRHCPAWKFAQSERFFFVLRAERSTFLATSGRKSLAAGKPLRPRGTDSCAGRRDWFDLEAGAVSFC